MRSTLRAGAQRKDAPAEAGADAWVMARALTFVTLAVVAVYLHPWSYGFAGVGAATVALVVASLAAALGVRAAGWVALALGVVVLYVPQLDEVPHYHHVVHVLWFAAVILVGRDGPWQRCLWALVAFVYVVPGLAKLSNIGWLVDGGMAQIFARNRAMLDWHAPIPSGGWFPAASAVAVVLLELAVPVLLFTRWRKPALLAAVGFHLSAGWVLGIVFWSLWMLYPILWADERPSKGDLRPVVVTSAIIVLSLLAGQSGWPFATYPRFNSLAGMG